MLDESNADCVSIFKWLMSRCKNNGKFDTFNQQDMIMGIEALSEFSTNDRDVVNVTIDAANNTKYFNVNRDNAIVLQTQKLCISLFF